MAWMGSGKPLFSQKKHIKCYQVFSWYVTHNLKNLAVDYEVIIEEFPERGVPGFIASLPPAVKLLVNPCYAVPSAGKGFA